MGRPPYHERHADLVMTVAEAARTLGIGRNAGYAAVHRGEIPSLRVGRRILVPRRALERLVGAGGKGKRHPSRRSKPSDGHVE